MRFAIRAVPALLLLTLISLPAIAEEGRIPIFEPVSLDGTVSDISGKYILTRDLVSATGNAIEFNGTGVEDIELDLNGFVVTANGSGIVVQDVRRVVIRNGFVRRSGSSNYGVLVQRVSAQSDLSAVIEDLQLTNSWIEVRSLTDYRIRRNFINASSGVIALNSSDDRSSGVIEDNRIIATVFGLVVGPGGGSSQRAQNVVVRNNRFQDGDLVIAEVDGLVVEGNAAVETSGFHLQQVYGCRVTGNVITSSESIFRAKVGIKLEDSSDCLIVDNVANRNDYGIYLNDSVRCDLRGNQTNNNDEFGLFIDAGSTGALLRENTSRGNLGTSAVCGNPGVATCGAPDLCDFINGSAGDNFVPGPPPC